MSPALGRGSVPVNVLQPPAHGLDKLGLANIPSWVREEAWSPTPSWGIPGTSRLLGKGHHSLLQCSHWEATFAPVKTLLPPTLPLFRQDTPALLSGPHENTTCKWDRYLLRRFQPKKRGRREREVKATKIHYTNIWCCQPKPLVSRDYSLALVNSSVMNVLRCNLFLFLVLGPLIQGAHTLPSCMFPHWLCLPQLCIAFLVLEIP